MSESKIRDLSKEFAIKIVNLTKVIKQTDKETVMSNQLLRSGTSIGANIHEAQYAQGSLDFISKLEIALKECFETEYWLELLYETGYIKKENFQDIISDCGTLRKLLIASCKTVKERIGQ